MTEPSVQRHEPVLVCLGGLPATGKTTIARDLARSLRAAYIRIDTIESCLARAEGRFEDSNAWEQPPGYLIGYEVAADQLRIGTSVVAESVNPVRASRDAWLATGLGAGGKVLEVEVVCSDPREHRSRAAGRTSDIPGLSQPTWEQISQREYHSWERDRLVLDTALLSVGQSVQRVLDAARLLS